MSDRIVVEQFNDGSVKAEHVELALVACDLSRDMAIFKLGKLVARQQDFERRGDFATIGAEGCGANALQSPPLSNERLSLNHVQAQALRDAAKVMGDNRMDWVSMWLNHRADELDPPAKEGL